MVFKNRKGFVLMEVIIALAVVGILLTAILQLQLTLTNRLVFNTNTSCYLFELKKDLCHSFIQDEAFGAGERVSKLKKITGTTFQNYKSFVPYAIVRTWDILAHTKSIGFLFLKESVGEKNEQ
jgi:prepilin-type N-terminal cleavage/methylation domain-containing protein